MSQTVTVLNVKGMNCGGCSSRVDKKLAGLPGVTRSETSAKTGTSLIEFDSDQVDVQSLIDTVSGLGYVTSRKS